jgi:hypothetical protein
MQIGTSIDIDAPAEQVWQIIGPGFADVSGWASAVETSRPSGGPGPGDAPCDGRICTVTATGFDHLTETLTHYDPATRSLTYRATRGMPRFVTLATNTWRVQPKPDGGSTFTMHATVHLAGVGRAVAPLLRGYLLRVGRRTAGDLKSYAETGHVSDATGGTTPRSEARRVGRD